ncbi:hypothetical protein PAPYR_9851 [Paratrimastix pyriformis]|uniref:Uncharacterized protein n=1 Tax=Paratrimastix pyriformis TaxID=342808 RepID=A0ABQ8UA70_9EUKA|nr:hypothetical protein PAPYR_9851 [Paratrimastix pyriformis]
MERVTECLVTKDEREVIAVVLFSWPIGPTTPDGSVPGTLPKPKIVSVLNSHVGSSVARASMLKGASAPLRPCTSGSRCGVLRADWGLPAPLQNVSVGSTNARPRPLHPIDETDTLAAVPFGTPIGAREERPRAPTYTFQSLPIIPAHPIPTSEGHDGAAPSREGEHPCKAENSALAVARQVLEQKVGGSIPASDEVKKPEGFPGTYGRPPRRKIEIVMGTLQ